MKIRFLILAILVCIALTSCEKEVYDNTINGFSQLESDLISKFGKKSYFTDFIINVNEQEKLEVNLLVTDNPYNYKMFGWNYKNGKWKKVTEVDLELENGDIKDYLYSIQDQVNIVKIGFLVEKTLSTIFNGDIGDLKLKRIEIISPNKGKKTKLGYIIECVSGEKKICDYYNLQGHLVKQEIN
ncbi:hypothetical protein [Tenacibaculum sp. M341]|uniref:hypothetical protein n=1 Tax=Tenacibaculum sp. M341 TaxID=2530339 RepID=UPI0010473A7E|nr:hypothetical protein [Tenacibaculum sp. M341]TCI93139.1 hypothetical protein EYW44_05850 [Tenacibaculum sp. M341]